MEERKQLTFTNVGKIGLGTIKCDISLSVVLDSTILTILWQSFIIIIIIIIIIVIIIFLFLYIYCIITQLSLIPQRFHFRMT